MTNKELQKNATPKDNKRYAYETGNLQVVVYDNYSGTPILVTFLSNRWWVTTPGEKLQPLVKSFDGKDIGFVTLCEAGGKVGALALARMLGHALENPEDDVRDVMHWRVAELNRLGVEFDLMDEPLLLELDVFPNGQNSRREGKFSVMCYAKGACNECLFNIDGFYSKADAEDRAMFYFDFLDRIGIRFTIN